jgi:hypothetical protein
MLMDTAIEPPLRAKARSLSLVATARSVTTGTPPGGDAARVASVTA